MSIGSDAAEPTEVVHHQVDVLIVSIRHDRGYLAGPTHRELHATKPGLKAGYGRYVPVVRVTLRRRDF